MVNGDETFVPGAAARAAERRLVLSYAPETARAGVAALLDLDDTLAAVIRQMREPMIAQMRLTWWHDALSKLDTAAPPAQPVLVALAAAVLPHGVTGAELATLVEGWEALIEGEPADPGVRSAYAAGRGERLFALAARLCGGAGSETLAAAGHGWALADLSRSVSDAAAGEAAAREAGEALSRALAGRWPRHLRASGAMAHQAAMDLKADRDLPLPGATPGRIARLGWHRLTGR